MNLAGTEYSLETKSFDIFVSGCNRACPGCFNPEAQDFNYGERLNHRLLGNIALKIIDAEGIVDNIRLMGGDPMCQKESEIHWLSKVLRETFSKKSLHLYTGAEFNDLPKWCLEYFDVIKTGRYIEELKQSEGLASSNQRYWYRGVDF